MFDVFVVGNSNSLSFETAPKMIQILKSYRYTGSQNGVKTFVFDVVRKAADGPIKEPLLEKILKR